MDEALEIPDWINSAISLDDPKVEAVVDEVAAARVVYLGETNHFVHEKTDFRLWWLSQLGTRKRLVIGEEIAHLDGEEIDGFLHDGDARHLDRVATFGYNGRKRTDRDDWPPVFKSSAYPHAGMRYEHERLYAAIRHKGAVERFFGFDVDADGAGSAERVFGETLDDELMRLEATGDTSRTQIDSLRYLQLMAGATEFEQTRAAMAYREDVMKRRVDEVLAATDPAHLIVLLAHAFHLAKDDACFGSEAGIGPGGGQANSLGHYLTQEKGLDTSSVWMLCGEGMGSQPLASLPNKLRYPRRSLNRQLLAELEDVALLRCGPRGMVGVGNLYNTVAEVELARQADCVMFFPTVTPLQS